MKNAGTLSIFLTFLLMERSEGSIDQKIPEHQEVFLAGKMSDIIFMTITVSKNGQK